ncbi:DNA polymerase I A, chloroplastic-like isoform X3 [Zingiber officinale]|uniref:DNA polymerase I A, chloroplastic-like isoform X3 n=1 Tax=Zingiber officinale TaxID=94328 RepID=UPI001C4D5990|nr:DNA polymerase I A, chloroplastic-like isoform X3 [Zingiber officinale]
MGLGFSTYGGALRHHSASYNRVWFSCVSRVISSSNATAHIRPYSSNRRQEVDSTSQLPCLKSRSDNQKIVKGCASVENHDAKIRRVAAQFRRGVGNGGGYNGGQDVEGSSKIGIPIKQIWATCKAVTKKQLAGIYDKILVIDNISTAKVVVQFLTKKYMKFIHACHVEVTNFDENSETPVGHGEIICFSIYSGPEADFNEGKSCIWVDVLDGGKSILLEFAPFFEDSSIKKVFHNYSFFSHVLMNHGIRLSGFHADTVHLARLCDSTRRADEGYSLESLLNDPTIMSLQELNAFDALIRGKKSMKSIFGKKKLKKDGSEGKHIILSSVDILQREERILWICYCALDSIRTLKLFDSLKEKLMDMPWNLDSEDRGTMYDFYLEYWQPLSVVLVQMESRGVLVDRHYLSEMVKLALSQKEIATNKFRKWASNYCPDAGYMNVGSDAQIRQLLFGGALNRNDHNECLPDCKSFKVLDTVNDFEEGKKSPKFRTILLHRIGEGLQTDVYTASGWPSVSGNALKVFAGNLNDGYKDQSGSRKDILVDQTEQISDVPYVCTTGEHICGYGSAYKAFGGGKEGREACTAIADLYDAGSIDSLISNYLLPLQDSCLSCADGRIHCLLNINTETGRISAMRPNLQTVPARGKDRYKIRQAFIAEPANSLIVADYEQLELRILAHLANCTSMLDAFRAGGDFHSRTATNIYAHVRDAVEEKKVLLEWHPQLQKYEPPVPLLKDVFAAERKRAKLLNFSIAYGKTPLGISHDWKIPIREAEETINLWYKGREEVLHWQNQQKMEARNNKFVKTLLGRSRHFPSLVNAGNAQRAHIDRMAINTPVQGSAADVTMCAMLEIEQKVQLKELGWKLLLQVHDELILEGPTKSAELAKAIVVDCMTKPFNGTNFLKVDLAVDAKIAQNWYAAK